MTCRWHNMYTKFIPEVERPAVAQEAEVQEPQSGEKTGRTARRPTDKGALFFKYNCDVHEWLTHLRHVHAENPPVTMNGKSAKASNPLAAPGEALYYFHSKTASYNDFFFDTGMCVSPRPSVWYVHFTTSLRSRTLRICLLQL
jgi:hypothetical protein